MTLDFVRTIERRDHRERDEAANLERQVFARPEGAPRVLGDEFLLLHGELVGAGVAFGKVLFAHDLLTGGHAFLVQRAFHYCSCVAKSAANGQPAAGAAGFMPVLGRKNTSRLAKTMVPARK